MIGSTSKPLVERIENPESDVVSVAHQGAGVPQAWSAAHVSTIPSLSKILINDTDHLIRSHTISIKNVGKKPVTYLMTHKAAPTFNTFESGRNYPLDGDMLLRLDVYARVNFSSSPIIIDPGQTGSVTTTFTLPADADPAFLPICSGYVVIDASNGDKLSIPYLGAAGSLKYRTVLERTSVVRSDEYNGEPAPAGTKFTLPLSGDLNQLDPDRNWSIPITYPFIYGQLPFGSPLVDLFVYSVKQEQNDTRRGDVNLGRLPGYPKQYVTRSNDITEAWYGRLEGNSRVEPGRYMFAYKVLKIGGDRANEDDYERAWSTDFEVEFSA